MGSARPSARPDRSPRRHGRPAVEQELVDRLRQLPAGPEPDPGFTRELRAQLVAIAPRIVAESASEVGTRRPARPAGFLRRVRRPLVAIVSATAVLATLLGLAVWVSHGALPGQSLYGIKRASENFSLSLAGSDTDKGKAYLQQATRRATESTKLVGDPAGQAALTGELVKLLGSTLQSADSDTRNGLQLLGNAAVDQQSSAPIAGLPDWVSAQRARLTELQARLPAGAARNRTQASLALLQRAATRLAQWRAELGCGCLSPSRVDELGPLPCPNCLSLSKPTPRSSGLPTLPTVPSGQPSTPPPSLLPSLSLPGLGDAPTPTGTSTTRAAGDPSATLSSITGAPAGLLSLPPSLDSFGLAALSPEGLLGSARPSPRRRLP
jgi:hypothetical protein